MLHVLTNSILVTGLVIIMMMMIECLNVWSKGRFAGSLKGRSWLQVVASAFLGSIPGCMGGFAVVSLYSHGMLSLGALIAMMIASSGDEAFVMLAMVPKEALWIFLGLFILGTAVGVIVDLIHKPGHKSDCPEHFAIHKEEQEKHEHHHTERHFSWKRAILFAGVAVFIAALAFGMLEHDHEEAEHVHEGINLLDEEWMNILFACLSVGVLLVIIFGSDHFVNEHIWHHVVCHHLPRIFAWTFGTLLVISLLLNHFDITDWVSGNVILMILLAALIGIIPESGPHMIFVSLFATGVIPLPVLIASCISQDGHAGLPLLSESRKSFLIAKGINCLVAIAAGFLLMLI